MPASLLQCFAPLRLLSSVATILAILLLGCSSADPLVPVYGLVVIDGEPLSGASVTFYPASGGVCSVATTDISGRFSLRTQDGRLGAVAGSHQVAVAHPEDIPASAPAGVALGLQTVAYRVAEEPAEIVPQRYTGLGTSGLTVEVLSEEMQPVYLKLER